MIEIHEVHDWPERATPGPRVVVWCGRNRRQAEGVLKRLVESHRDSRFRYEMVRSEAPSRGRSVSSSEGHRG